MLKAFNTLIKPIYDHQTQLMGIEEEPTKIPVFKSYPVVIPITVQFGYTEDGEFIVEHCTHAGAREENLTWNAGLDDECDVPTLVCDKCYKQYDETDGTWDV